MTSREGGVAIHLSDLERVQSVVAVIQRSLRKGCLCHVPSASFVRVISDGSKFLYHFDGTARTEIYVKPLLAIFSCLRTFSKIFYHLDSSDTICKRFHEWILTLVKLKFSLLIGLSQLWSRAHGDPILRSVTESTFESLLLFLPCPAIETNFDFCRKGCQKILENFIQLKGETYPLGVRTVHSIFCSLDKDQDKRKKDTSFNCRSAHIKLEFTPRLHFETLKQLATSHLKLNWKTWTEKSLGDDGYNLEILTLWKNLVAVSSNLGFSQSREFISSGTRLSRVLHCPNHHLVKQKEVDVLNEILCYGSTLSIQSTIPCEVSDVAEDVLRLTRVVQFKDFHIPTVIPGFGGNQFKGERCEAEAAPSLGIIQGIVLLHLKSCAIVVREAQCCTSSDTNESDSSLSSHGSSSIADAEQEMKMIERNVVDILRKVKHWIIEQLELHPSSQLSQCVTVLFNEQDDAMIEGLLCLLDIFTGLQFGAHSMRHGSDLDTPLPEVVNPLQEFLDPIEAFENFLQTIASDASVILDFLVSNETCFLLYFLRLVKYFVKNVSTMNMVSERSETLKILKKVHSSIKKLNQKSLFPYEISPVLKQLDKLVPFYPV